MKLIIFVKTRIPNARDWETPRVDTPVKRVFAMPKNLSSRSLYINSVLQGDQTQGNSKVRPRGNLDQKTMLFTSQVLSQAYSYVF